MVARAELSVASAAACLQGDLDQLIRLSGLALANGARGLVACGTEDVLNVLAFSVAGDRIVETDSIRAPQRLEHMPRP
jgi:hypothetical protein